MSVNRPQTVLQHEGQLLQIAATYGNSDAAEHARGVIDGVVNGMLRIEDREDVAKFAFALADRVAGGVKGPTAWPLPQVAAVDIAPVAAPAAPRRYGFWTIYAIGWCCGAFVAAVIVSGVPH